MANPFDQFDQPAAPTAGGNPFDQFAPAAAPEKPGFVGALTRGFKRTLPETKGLLAGAGAAVAGAVGADGVRDKLLRTYQDIQQNEVAPLASQSGFIDSVQGDGSLTEWAGDVFGNFGGQAVQSLAAGAAGALVGSAVPGAGTVAGGVGGLVARTGAKKLVEGAVANMVARGVAKDAAEKLVLRRMGGAALANSGLNIAQEVGIGFTERAQDAQAAGEELTRADALRAIAYGIPAGLLDTATEAFTAGKLMRGASSSPNRLTRMAAGAATGAVTEGGTEGAQAVLERAGAAQALTGTEAYKDYIENVAAGALGGSVPGAAGGIRTPDALTQPPPTKPAQTATTPATPPATIIPPSAAPTGPLTRAAATLAGAPPPAAAPAPAPGAQPPANPAEPAPASEAPAPPAAQPTDLYTLAMDAAVKRGITSINGLQKELDIPREQARSLINALETANVLSKPDERKRRRLLIDPATGALLDEAAVKADRKQKSKQDRAELEAWARNLAGDLRVMDGLEQPRPDPAAGPVSAAAASAVDTGAADIVQMQQAAQQIEEQQPTAADQQRAQREQLQQAKMERQAQALDAQTYGEDDLRALIEADLDAGKTIDAARMMRLAKQAGVKPRAVDTLRRTILAERASGSQPALTDQPIDAEFTDVTGQDAPALPAPTVDPKVAGKLFPFPTEAAARASADKLTQRKGVPYTVAPHPREAGKWVTAPQSKATLALPAPAPAPAAQQPAPVEGEPIDAKWTAFAPESGTLGVPRAQMPQIRAEHRGALVNYLNARGIGHDSEQVPADTLKPTQAEFAPAKVQKAASGGTDRSILVSQDGHVLDGHHQWMAARNAGLPVNIIRLQAPIQDLLQAAKEFPSSTVAAGAATGAATAPDTTTKEQSNAADGQEGQQGQGRREGRREALLSPGATAEQSSAVASPERDKALKRIERGTAFFGTRAKADEFIANAGLGDSHEAVQVKAGRFDVRAKQAAAVDVSTKPQNANTTAEGKPADAASAKVRQLADAEQRPGVKRSLNALADAMAAKDEKTVSAWVAENPDNTTLRKAFEDATGVKLPRTIKGGREAVSAWAAGKVDATPQQAQDDQQQPTSAAPAQEGTGDTANRTGAATLDRAMAERQSAEPVPAVAEQQSTSGAGPGDRRADAGSVRRGGGPARERSDRGGDVGNQRAIAIAAQDVADGGVEPDSVAVPAKPDRGSVTREGTDYVPPAGSLERDGSWLKSAQRNVDAIELALRIKESGRPATTEQQAILAQYVGFGASEIRNKLFPVPSEYARSQQPDRVIWPNLIPDGPWKALAERLEKLPSDAQKSLLRSTQYAHYTSEGVVRSIWRGLQHLGFTGGKIFEPGFGKGTFPMLMPASIREGSLFTGIEMDHVSAMIGALLQPQQNMIEADYTKRKFPRDFFDVAIGNPPFARTAIESDPEYAKYRFSLHDYFFAKTVDRVRPGGLLVFVTSRYTMDKQNDRARKYLAERADLIGAVRLPQTAFKDNAGTDVVTDVLVLRKRMPGEAAGGAAWAGLAEVDTKDGKVSVNEYFASHPENVLGEQRISGNRDDLGRRINGLRSDGEYVVVSYEQQEDMEARFEQAMLSLPANVYSATLASPQQQRAQTTKVDFDPKVRREGVVYIGDDGAIMRVESGVGVPLAQEDRATGGVKLTPANKAWLRGYVELRDKVQLARQAQLSDGDWQSALDALNTAYDAFRKEHGPINDFTVLERTVVDEDGTETKVTSRRFKNKRILQEDYDRAVVMALETITEDNEIVKGPFLRGRTIGAPQPRTVQTIGDALAVSLDETGRLDLDDVARRLGISREQAIEDLGDQVFEVPGGTWVMADDYLSGDVRTKLDEAIEAARADSRFQRNVKALESAQPEKLGPSQIVAKLGASWIPEDVANAFAEHIGAGKVTFLPSTEGWQVAGGNKRTERRAGADFGTAHRSPSELLEAALNSRSVVVKKSVGEGKDRKEVTDKEATEAAAAMLKKIRDTFKTWVWADADRAATLTEIYNQRYNNIAPRRFDGSHLTLPGVSTRYKLHPHQKRAIWRQVASGNTYLAHAVGAGKTIEMIAGGMEQKRLGLIQKPMYVVPNHMLEQFANEFMELYPLANIMVADDENFTGDRRRSFIAQASMNKPDAIVITHSAFERIGVKPESAEPLKRELLDDLYAELAIAEKDKDQRVRRSQLEQQIEAVEQRFDKITGAGSKDNTVTFEDMGVDMLYVDEAHAYRKLDFTTEQSIKGVDPNGSKRALDMYVKTRILEARRPGRAFVFASGTPVTNTMGELYTVQRFFQPAELQRMGISQFDSWSRQFGETVATLESNAAGRYELVERFAKFDNVPELMSRIRSFMDVLTSDQLGASVTRPDLEGGKPELIVVEGTDALKTYMRTVLQTRLERSKQWKPSKQQPHNPDPVIAITTDGRFAALDPRFFGAELPDGAPTKLNTMADEIAKEYHATADNQYLDRATGAAEAVRGGAQIVFYNLGFGQQSQSNRGFNARRALTDRLVEAGVKREHILWFDDADTDAKKEAMFKAMRSGQARILIGSAKKMGTGVNVQKRLTTLHYFDPPWFPSDVEQPHGRIIRQGNQNKQVRIKWYATKGTYDSTMWQMVARKQRFIDQAFQGDKNLRRMEDLSEASLFEQAAALASGDPRALQLAGLRQDVERLERLQAAHASDQVGIRAEISKLEYERDWRKRSMAELEAATKAVGGYYSFQGAKVKGRLYEKQGDFGDALKSASLAAAAKFADSPDAPMEPVVLGTLEPAGIEIVLAADYVRSIMNGQMSYKLSGLFQIGIRPAGVLEMAEGKFLAGDIGDLDGLGLARRVTNLPNRIGQRLRFETTRVPEIDTELRRLGKKRGAPFEYAQELVEKFAELKQLEADLEAEAKADAERSAQQASAAASSAQFVAATNAEAGKASFAKSGEAPSVSPATARAWRDLAAIDGLFQRPRSDAKTFAELTAAILPDAEVVEFDDGATITVQPEKDAKGKPTGDPKAVTMTVLDGELSMDASQLTPGVHRGSALYAVALSYAHNNGLVFVPDPAGVSEDAMIRRTEHMLSSALKTGTTRHMLPHTAQGLDWRVGDDEHNVLELIRASADNVMDAVPELKAVDYDWNTGQFVAADGRPVTRDDFRALADSPSARAARAGVSTLRRGVVSRSLERRAGTPAWRGVVARLLQLGRAGLRGSQLEGLMYGRGATGARGMTVEALNGIFAPALKQLAADRRLDVQVVATHADLPQSIRDQDDFDETVQAAFQGRTAYFVASAIRDRAQARRLFAHEVVGHYGMEGLLGPALFAELKRQILSLRDRGKWADVFSEVSRRYERNADGTFRPLDDDTFAAETIGVFAERNILTSILQRAMAAVRAFLRRFFPDMEISKAELRQLLWEAGQRLEGRPYRPTAERALGAGRASSMRQAVERYSFGRNDIRQAPPSEGLGASGVRAAFAKAPSTLSRLQELIKPDDRSLLDRIKDRLQDWRPAALGALQLRHLGELAEDTLPPVAQYADVVQRMATMRNELQERGHGIVEAGMKYQGAHGEEAKRLFRMLHDATLAGVDPAEAHQPLRMLGADYRTNVEVTEKSVREFVRTMKGQAKLNAGSASVYISRAKEARQLLQQERKRAQSHRQMAPAFAQLSPEAKALWVQMRDAYRAQSAEYEQALISRIEALDFDKAKKATQIARMRLQFESARVPFYVPLARWGEYWVSGTAPDGTREFYMQERASDQRRVRADLESRGYTAIGAGVKIDTARAQDGATAGFMAEMDQMLKEANAPEKVRDEAFQLYLRTLPDLSIRKNFLHRQGTPGYSQDAIRALAGHIFHGSFQIARMRYTHELDALRREAEQIARNMATMGDPAANGAGAVVNELKKRHEWVLNPTDNGLVNKISSLGFVYYLGLTPAAALVNLLQTPMVAFPVLAARHDAGKVARELWRAMRESLGSYGHMERNLQGDELLAHQEFARRGVFDKTQAHNLAGVSESDTHAYSPGWHKVMTVISHVFHKAEVVNREATAMAAYRLARADGAGHAEAIHQADRDVHESQFDYSNANRARWMQSSAAKVLLMFRQYSLAVTWLIGRAFYQAIKGADPETRTMARRKLTGILGMTALFSGTLGLPVLGSVGAILNALAAAFGDDDEPWDWETELRAFLREMLGDTGAEAILRGPVQALTGVAIAQRVGISDLWFREPDRELEGRAWANYLFEQAAGPMGGLVTNFFRGQQLMAEGHVWRGVETIMPKAIKDAMKSMRYVTDGVNNLRGDAIVEDLNVFESLAQIAGFSPASVASAYDYQRDIKGYEQYILDRRRALMDAFALAYRLGDIEGRDAVLAKMREFSAAYPALAITADGIRRSLMSRSRYSQQADAGIIVDRRLRAGLEDRLGASG